MPQGASFSRVRTEGGSFLVCNDIYFSILNLCIYCLPTWDGQTVMWGCEWYQPKILIGHFLAVSIPNWYLIVKNCNMAKCSKIVSLCSCSNKWKRYFDRIFHSRHSNIILHVVQYLGSLTNSWLIVSLC